MSKSGLSVLQVGDGEGDEIVHECCADDEAGDGEFAAVLHGSSGTFEGSLRMFLGCLQGFVLVLIFQSAANYQ